MKFRYAAVTAPVLAPVTKHENIIGLIRFDMDKRRTEKADDRLEADKSSLRTFRSLVTKYSFGRS